MKRIFFFATPSDIVPVLERWEANAPLKFVDTTNLTTPNKSIYLEASEIPNPGIATRGTGSQSQSYMVSHRNTKNYLHEYVTRKGEKRWSLDNSDNEEAVILTLSGLWETGTLLPGNVATMHETPPAQQLMNWFLAALKNECFKKVGQWWLGAEAITMLQSGGRLATVAEQSPPEYDLQLPEELK